MDFIFFYFHVTKWIIKIQGATVLSRSETTTANMWEIIFIDKTNYLRIFFF